MSEVTVSISNGIAEVRAYGGTRRERGAAIGAAVRKLRQDGWTVDRFHISYSETYGFQTLTWTRYRMIKACTCGNCGHLITCP